MADLLIVIPFAIAAYLVGGIPFAYVAGKRVGTDIRKFGNGNVGSVNAFRTLGWRAGVFALAMDTIKGAAVIVAGMALDLPDMGLFAGAMATVIGHNWSPYIGFSGGKGVAVIFGISLGMMPVLSWLAAPFVFAAFAATKSWVWAFGVGIIALNTIIWLSGAEGRIVMMCVALSVVVVMTHFVREAKEIREAIAMRQWRKVGQIE